jgi:hypothetical protein
MAARNPGTDFGSGVRGAVRVRPLDRSDEPHGSLSQAPLPLLLIIVLRATAQEPLLRDLLEKLRHTLLLRSGRLLEIGLETG